MAFLVAGVGYIGSRLVEELLNRGEEVVAIDNLFSTDSLIIRDFQRRPRFQFVRGSVANPKALRGALSLAGEGHTIFSLAAQASAHPDAASASYTERTNLVAPRLMLEAMREFGVGSIVFASSFKVYGDELPPVIEEGTPYGRFRDLSHLSKCYAEKLMEMFALLDGLRCVTLRLGIVYGLAPVMKRDYRFMTVPNKFSLQAVRHEEMVINAAAGNPTGFIHVADAASALLAAGLHKQFKGYTPVNAATEIAGVAEVAQLVAEIAGARGLTCNIRKQGQVSDRESPKVRSRLAETGFVPRHTLRTGLGEVIDYFRVAEAVEFGA